MAPHSPWFACGHGSELLLLGRDIGTVPVEKGAFLCCPYGFMRGVRGLCPAT